MRKFLLIMLTMLISIGYQLQGQAPSVEWKKSYGGSGSETAYDVIQTSDGGYIMVGDNESNDGDVIDNHEFSYFWDPDVFYPSQDMWVVKVDSIGEIEWSKSLGSVGREQAISIVEISDGGYMIAGSGMTEGQNGFQSYGDNDAYLIKINNVGDIQWIKNYGGSKNDTVHKMIKTSDNHFLIVGVTKSVDLDFEYDEELDFSVSVDAFIIKVDENGNKKWVKCYRGLSQDYLNDIIELSDGDYVAVGYSKSSDRDVPENKGNEDFWVIKVDSSNGNLIWSKTYGGSTIDKANSVIQTNQGEILVVGHIYAWPLDTPINGDITEYYGNTDGWIIKLSDSTGELISQKTIGSEETEEINAIVKDSDGNFVLAGVKSVPSNFYDYWIVKVTGEGEVIWETSANYNPGFYVDIAYSIVPATGGGYAVAGAMDYQFGLVKLCGGPPSLETEQEVGICSNTSVILEVSTDGQSVYWYDEEDADPIHTGTSYTTPELMENTTYWVAAANGACISEKMEINITVSPFPTLIVEETEVTTCENSDIELSVLSDGDTVNWYDSEYATTPVHTGISYLITGISESVTYWVEAANGGCVTERQEITVNVVPFAELDVEEEIQICAGKDAYLYAYSEGNVIFWYANEEDEEYLYHGNNFIVEGLMETTSYWVEAYDMQTGCKSPRVEVTVTVNPVPEAPITVEVHIAEEGQTLADLEEDIEFEGTLTWYADEYLTIELPNSTLVHDNTVYFVTQTVNECESEAAVIEVEMLGTSDVNNSAFAYYPNPVKDKLYFTGKEKVESVQIYDMSGKLLINQQRATGIETLDVTKLPKGSYVVKAITIKGVQAFKIVKN